MWGIKSTSKDFEDRVFASLKRKYTQKKGWEIEPQRKLGFGDRVDFLLTNSRTGKMIVIDAKDKEALTTGDLRQLSAYKRKAKADQAIFYVPRNFKRSPSMADTLRRRKLEIHKTNIAPKKSFW